MCKVAFPKMKFNLDFIYWLAYNIISLEVFNIEKTNCNSSANFCSLY